MTASNSFFESALRGAGHQTRKGTRVGSLESMGARIFWAVVGVIFLLVVFIFLVKIARRIGGPVAGVFNTVESAAGLQG